MKDAMAGYLQELTEAREMFDGRYDDIKSGRVTPVDGEAFFDSLRQHEDELLKKRKFEIAMLPKAFRLRSGKVQEIHPPKFVFGCCHKKHRVDSGDADNRVGGH